jgi:hypothetical protein
MSEGYEVTELRRKPFCVHVKKRNVKKQNEKKERKKAIHFFRRPALATHFLTSDTDYKDRITQGNHNLHKSLCRREDSTTVHDRARLDRGISSTRLGHKLAAVRSFSSQRKLCTARSISLHLLT